MREEACLSASFVRRRCRRRRSGEEKKSRYTCARGVRPAEPWEERRGEGGMEGGMRGASLTKHTPETDRKEKEEERRGGGGGMYK